MHLEDFEEGEEEEDDLEDEVIDPEAKRLRYAWKNAPAMLRRRGLTTFRNGDSSNAMFDADGSLSGSKHHS